MTSADRTKTALRRRTVLGAAIAVIGFAGAASVHADTDPVDLTVVNRETGQPLRVWRHHGRLFVAGEPGVRYSLRVTNHTDGRVLVVMSVDGVNILTGETANYDQRGYVFKPYESYDVTGWRKSNAEVAAFTFAPLPQSYAARTGRPGDVGVVGMAVFSEKVAVSVPEPRFPEPHDPVFRPEGRDGGGSNTYGALNAPGSRRAAPPPPPLPIPPAPHAFSQAAPAPPPPPSEVVVTAQRRGPSAVAAFSGKSALASDALARRQDEKLGTAHGAREWSVVNLTSFERATPYPLSLRRIEYDTYDHLVASGVIPRWRNAEHRPRPFPSEPDGEGYVPDPPGER